MASLNYTPQFWEHMVRITDFLSTVADRGQALHTYDLIVSGIQILVHHPEIGRKSMQSDFRELVISHGNTGYIALYQYQQLTEIVTIVAIRHQRESGYH
ncbi:type II toxin-antitoxin system RelE/ParE family toxin [Methylophilus aquaticus]|uniref:Type II toxin-antitoxin system RelE/ParE family toxin n=1 Tax=Methylophilus aquaticus TaxID=1971610 RepID=A0ABT9JQ91_9PROT|nr:type II toxin-antitoxin system RelE/ParE family toxin [Methylophilus aquaticus]MDP8566714.1 type II toxin-antitoxin system RelE/ParE family toxin [Methylophilus aquaticus]